MPKVTVYVTLKPTLLDAQGRTVEEALRRLGYDEVSDVRIGKVIEMQIASLDSQIAQNKVAEMCDKLLANPVIESYCIETER